MDIARIDYWASSGSSLLHRASVMSKLLMVLFVVSSAVLSRSVLPLFVGYVLMLFISAVSGLPVVRMAGLSLYAAIFSVLYGLSIRGADPSVYGLVILKAVTPALSVLILISSTPYPRLFSFIGGALPELISSGLFMTYRSFFALLDLMHQFTVALRLRAGISRASRLRTIATIPSAIALLILRAVERSSRMYAVMTVRGYNGRMAEQERVRFTRHDWLPVGTGAAVLFLVIMVQ